jgi:hypothetical protein
MQNVTIIVSEIKRETEKAIMIEGVITNGNISVHCNYEAINIWLPKSQITIKPILSEIEITVPAWLAAKNNFRNLEF